MLLDRELIRIKGIAAGFFGASLLIQVHLFVKPSTAWRMTLIALVIAYLYYRLEKKSIEKEQARLHSFYDFLNEQVKEGTITKKEADHYWLNREIQDSIREGIEKRKKEN